MKYTKIYLYASIALWTFSLGNLQAEVETLAKRPIPGCDTNFYSGITQIFRNYWHETYGRSNGSIRDLASKLEIKIFEFQKSHKETAPPEAMVKELAEIYLKNRRLMEAAWLYDRTGNTAQAEIIIAEITKIFKNPVILKRQLVHDSTAGSELWTLQGDIQAIAKKIPEAVELGSDDYVKFVMTNPFTEIAYYEMDRVLKLDVIPYTTMSLVKGQVYSLQYFVHEISSDIKPVYYNGNLPTADYLAFYLDRTPRNVKSRPGNITIGYDHGPSFFANPPDIDQVIIPPATPEFYANLQKAPEEVWRKKIGPWLQLSEKTVGRNRNLMPDFMDRRQRILADYEARKARGEKLSERDEAEMRYFQIQRRQ